MKSNLMKCYKIEPHGVSIRDNEGTQRFIRVTVAVLPCLKLFPNRAIFFKMNTFLKDVVNNY